MIFEFLNFYVLHFWGEPQKGGQKKFRKIYFRAHVIPGIESVSRTKIVWTKKSSYGFAPEQRNFQNFCGQDEAIDDDDVGDNRLANVVIDVTDEQLNAAVEALV